MQPTPSDPGSRPALFGFWLFVALSAFFVAGPWAGFHGALLGGVALLMAIFPPQVRLPKLWWLIAGVFALAACASFLPAAWFGVPAWRTGLENLGVRTGALVVIQPRPAAEQLALFLATLLGGLWLAGHRANPATLRGAALAFVLGVAAYAVLSKTMQGVADEKFGFFPNRNHTATYLAMGSICGLGCMLQALRDKRFVTLGIALAATGICLWAVAGWSVSRGGVVLLPVGVLLWLALPGRGYLGANGAKALALIVLAGVGLFFIADSGVKDRISGTVDRASSVISADAGEEKPAAESARDLDFRIPTALDAFGLIRDFPWTGIGAGQFLYVFPQYRQLAAIANDSDSFHPESDWLWMASEAGIPATLALAALVLVAAWKSARDIRRGRDRTLRAACLAAALLVAIHGIFDVPGHRITLAWAAALLFALSLRPREREIPANPPPALAFRAVGIVLFLFAAALMAAQWRGEPEAATPLARQTTTRVRALYREDLARQEAGKPPLPEGEDLLEKCLPLLEGAAAVVPLDRQVRYLQGFIALHFEDMAALTDKAFAIERALDPHSVGDPVRQGLAWSNADPARTEMLWREALRRADWMDRHHPGSRWGRAQLLQQLGNAAAGKQALENIFRNLDGRDSAK